MKKKVLCDTMPWMSREISTKNIFSALEVARICGVVNQTAINWIRGGHLKAFTTPGGQFRVYREDLIAFMNSRDMHVPEELTAYSVPRHSILVVDDDRALNTVVSKFLIKHFDTFDIYQAFDGFEAGVLVNEKKPELILLDLDLPGIDGFSLCEKITTSPEFGNPAIYIITGLTDDGVEDRVKKLGASEFFRKPLDMPRIAASITSLFLQNR